MPARLLVEPSLKAAAQRNAVIVGHDFETGERKFIGDDARRAGLYVLGRSGTGKSTLLLHILDQDIQNGHGVFFLDPHGDAIEELVAQHCSYAPARAGTGRAGGLGVLSCNTRLRVLNPENKTYSFGINLLACKNPANRDHYRNTYNRAYSVFRKIWEIEWEQKPWLQKITQHIIYAFIENQEFTLAEVPMFLDLLNPDYIPFREYVVGNIKQNEAVADFWRFLFRAKGLEDQQREVDAALTRVQILLADPDVRDIVGQKETTVDFADIIGNRRVLLLKLSAHLAEDSKKFLGTIVLNELIHAVANRDKLPAKKRHQFCIFVDEVQNFADSKDFAVLFTQARKLGVATTIAHVERFGQLADNKPIIGATSAAGNKVLFTLSDEDAPKLAPEFAKRPPMEMKYEQQLGISQNPVDVLLRGHKNPQIKKFVDHYLRPLHERLADTREDMESQRLIRMDMLDEVALYRIDAQLLPRHVGYALSMSTTLGRAQNAISEARDQTSKLMDLHFVARGLRAQLRLLNRFFVLIMEGDIKPEFGNEAFSAFLTSLIEASFRIPPHQAELVKLYISLVYGDPQKSRVVPFALAHAHGLLPHVVTPILQAAADTDKREKEAFRNESRNRILSGAKLATENLYILQLSFRDDIRREISTWELEITEPYEADHYIELYILIHEYPRVAEILEPYLSSRFADPWRSHFSDGAKTEVSRILKTVQIERQLAVHGLTYFRLCNPKPYSWDALQARLRDWPPYPGEEKLYEISLLDAFERFLTRHGEGAFIALILLRTLENPVGWRKGASVVVDKHLRTELTKGSYEYRTLEPVYSVFPLYNMLYLPTLQNREPIEVLRSLAELNSVLHSCGAESLAKYAWRCPRYFDDDRREPDGGQKYRPREWYRTDVDYFQLCRQTYFGEELEWLQGRRVPSAWLDSGGVGSWQHDAQILERALDRPALYPDAGGDHVILPRWWIEGDSLLRAYLRARAWSIARYGTDVADKTFPQPTIAGAKGFQVVQLIDFMMKVLQEEEKKEIKKRITELVRYQEQKAQEQFEEKFQNKVISLPDRLDGRVLNSDEREHVKAACWMEFSGSAYVVAVLVVINDFVQFCRLLSLPENHVKDKTGQYVEWEVPSRTVRDMTDDMAAYELMRLPPHQAYAKLIQHTGGGQSVYIGKIKTLPPYPNPAWADAMDEFVAALTNDTEPDEDGGHTALVNIEGEEQRLRIAPGGDWARFITSAIELRTAVINGMCKERALIREEIRQRQAPWRTGEALLLPRTLKSPPPTQF